MNILFIKSQFEDIFMNYIFVLSSVTYALKGKKILENNKIGSSLIKSGNLKDLRGCGYGLKISADDKEKSYNILYREGIKILEVIGEEK